MTDIPTPWRGLVVSAGFHPREQFSVSQIEKAFGSANEPDRGCLRAWALRYLWGLKQPDGMTYEQALALPETTEDEKRLRAGTIAKTLGKVIHRILEAYYKGGNIDIDSPAGKRIFPGLHLAPHPSQCEQVDIEKQGNPRTGPESDRISWVLFKDLVPTIAGRRYLIDWKSTNGRVDNKKNAELGKAKGSWTYQKTEADLQIDYQPNLYLYDEYMLHGYVLPARFVYFLTDAARKPEARAVDLPDQPLENVMAVVYKLDSLARELRAISRMYKSEKFYVLSDVPANILNCGAYGGCPYRSKTGGPCTAEDTQIIPMGRLLTGATRSNVGALHAAASPGFVFQT